MKVCSVIKWDNNNQNRVLAYKYPETDFNYLTQLIVHENQEAIFFMNGQALDSFGPGRYTLETQNIPLVSKALKRLTGDKNPFHCEVYFVNKVEQMGIKWGTDSKIQYVEPKYGFPLEIGMSGELSVTVENARKLLIKLVGTDLELTNEQFINNLRSFLNSKIKPYVAHYMKDNTVSIFEIDEHLEVFSNDLKNKLTPDFEDYGLGLEKFAVSTVAKTDDDKNYNDFKNIHFAKYSEIERANIEAEKTVINAKAQAAKRSIEGYTYQQERGFDVAQDIAKNEAKGQFTNLGVGLGTAAGVGASIGGVVGNAVNGALNGQENVIVCPKCGKQTHAGKFCQECGASLEGGK